MCHGLSAWSWKRRAEKLAQKERDTVKTVQTEDAPVTPAKPPVAPAKVESHEPVSA